MVARGPADYASRVTKPGRRVAVVFGGSSVEHDVSIITAQQVMAVLAEQHTVLPIYVAGDGRWWTGDSLKDVGSFASQPPTGAAPVELRLGGRGAFVERTGRRLNKERDLDVDVVVNAIHGTGGEDGSLLGALELTGIPYVGRGVAAAAVAMDKHLAKAAVQAAGIDVLDHERIERDQWESGADEVVEHVLGTFEGPTFVKPATLGSSVGVQRCATEEDLRDALELVFELDRQAIVEPFATGAIELNCAVIGRPGGELTASEVERPLGSDDGLSFEDKYLRGGGAKGKGGSPKGGKGDGMAAQDRVIPADVDPTLRAKVQEEAKRAHRALRLAGVVRYDFFVLDDGKRIVLNEPNTVPGSFSFYLFEPLGISFADIMDRLLDIAFEESREERSTTRTFESALLNLHIPKTA
jgi:D-alanine-D-alanine ligase